MRHSIRILLAVAVVSSFAHGAGASATRVLVHPLVNESTLPASEISFLGDALRSGLTEPAPGALELLSAGEAALELRGKVVPFAGGLAAVLELYRGDVLLRSVTTPRCPDSTALLTAIQNASAQLGAVLLPNPQSEEPPLQPDAAEEQVDRAPVLRPPRRVPTLSGPSRLKVRTDPPGAAVFVAKNADSPRQSLGQTPVDPTLEPGTYTLRIELEDHYTATRDVDLQPGRIHEYDFELGAKKPLHPLAIAGHALLWPGLVGIAAGGILTLDQDNLTPLWIALIAGGTATVTGVVLLSVSPSRPPGDKGIAVAPLPSGGAAVGYQASF